MIPSVYSTDALLNSIKTLEEEVERLRADRDSWAQQADDRVADCEQFITEIERLRNDLEVEKNYVKEYREGYCKQAAEINRLRNSLETITIVEVGESSAASMRKLALQALQGIKRE